MGIADLTGTTFSNTPKQGLEVIDVYDSEQVESFLSKPITDEDVVLLNKLYPDLKADKIQAALNNPAVKEYLASSGGTIDDLIKKARNTLPPGSSLSDYVGDFSLVDIKEGFEEYRKLTTSDEWASVDKLYGSSLMTNLKTLTDKTGIACMPCSSICGSANNNAGGDPSGGVVGAAKLWSDIERLIICGLMDRALSYLDENYGLFDSQLFQEVSAGLVKAAAAYRFYQAAEVLIEKANTAFGIGEKDEVVKATLSGFTIAPDLPLSKYPEEANKLKAFIDRIYPDWLYTDWGINYKILSAHYFPYLSNDIKKVLAYHADARFPIAVWDTHTLKGKSIASLTKANFPGVMLPEYK